MNKFAKTILTIYYALPTLIRRIDKVIYNRAVKSHCYGRGTQSTIEQMCNIVMLSDKKRQLEELKYVTEKTLKGLEKKRKKLLTMRYIERLPCQQIKQLCNMSDRTLFRQLSCAIDAFESALKREGFDNDWFCEIYLAQGWIKQIYNSID